MWILADDMCLWDLPSNSLNTIEGCQAVYVNPQTAYFWLNYDLLWLMTDLSSAVTFSDFICVEFSVKPSVTQGISLQKLPFVNSLTSLKQMDLYCIIQTIQCVWCSIRYGHVLYVGILTILTVNFTYI